MNLNVELREEFNTNKALNSQVIFLHNKAFELEKTAAGSEQKSVQIESESDLSCEKSDISEISISPFKESIPKEEASIIIEPAPIKKKTTSKPENFLLLEVLKRICQKTRMAAFYQILFFSENIKHDLKYKKKMAKKVKKFYQNTKFLGNPVEETKSLFYNTIDQQINMQKFETEQNKAFYGNYPTKYNIPPTITLLGVINKYY